jgi:Reverse transcriptase (RNA-dependent DNA polymerase)
MSVSRLRLKLAFRRVRDELTDQPKSGRAFVANPFELDLIEADYEGWIKDLRQQIRVGSFSPGPIEYCYAPKGGGLVRPGVRLGIADRVVYTAAVGACLGKIHAATKWSQRSVDFAMRVNGRALSKREWLNAPFLGWRDWSQESERRLALAKTRYVLSVDIAGYFENVSIGLLRSDLMRIGCDTDVVSLIEHCLRHWAPADDRGLPQGVLASDVLAKLYLEPFDRQVKDAGFTHMRYVDDVRVYCGSQREARRALVLITRLLRERGLTMQSAKTKIRPTARVADGIRGCRAYYRGYSTRLHSRRCDQGDYGRRSVDARVGDR